VTSAGLRQRLGVVVLDEPNGRGDAGAPGPGRRAAPGGGPSAGAGGAGAVWEGERGGCFHGKPSIAGPLYLPGAVITHVDELETKSSPAQKGCLDVETGDGFC
jgi:hypothetical protein